MTNLKLIAFLMILLSFNTSAAENISYSGRLVTPAGTPVVGPVNMKFDIVVDSDVKCTLNKTSVPLSNGVFNVSLDYGTTCTQFDGTLSKTIEAAYYNDKIPYIRVTDTTNTKTYPDQPIAAVPLAIHALSGGSEGYNLDLEYTCADGEILKMNSSNLFQCTSDLEGVTGVTAGTGLNGGTITSTGTIDINVGTGSGQIPQLDGSGKLAVSTIPNLPGSIITSGTIDEAYLPTADASNNGKLTSSDWNMFNNKQDDLGTGSAGQYLANGPAWATLNTQAVAEHSSNLYFTDARAKAATVADAISDAVTDVAPSQNAVFDALATKADANGNADIVADSITVDTQGGVNLAPYGAAAGNTSEIRFYELSGNGSNYTGFKSPDLLSSDIIYTLPPNGGTNNYVLSLTNSVTGELGWMDVSTASGLSNTGDVIINADSDSDNTGEVVFQTKGTDRVVIDNDGNVGIGVGVPTAKFDTRLTSSDTASGNIKLNRGLLYARPTSASSSTLFASESVVSTGGGTGQDLQKLFSSRNLIYHSDANGGTVNSAFASSSVVINKDIGTITNAIGARGRIANTSTGTIDTAYAFRAEIENSGGGTINNAYGLYVYDVPDATSSEYGLYQAGSDDLNYFAGNVGVGVLAPNELLTVEGVLSLRESAAPSVTANYGKIYVKTDGKAYFKNDAGTEFDITDNGDGGTVTSVATGTGLTGGPITTTGTISIANDGVTATQLADDAVDTAAIVDANVTTAKLADDAVTSAKLAAGAVDSNALGANSVSSSNIVDGTIVNADISGTAAIDYTKLDIANGEIPQAKVNSLTSDLASKLPLAGGTMTGDVAMGDNDITGLTSLGLNGATLGVVTVQAPLSVTSYTWQFPSTSGTSGQALFTDGTGATSWATVNTSSADGHSLDAADGSPTDVVYVDNNGRVGIGTTTPDSNAALEINHGSGYGLLVNKGNDYPAIALKENSGDLWELTDQETMFQIAFTPDSGSRTPHFNILETGEVGIGTTTPEGSLHIQRGASGSSSYGTNTEAIIESSANNGLMFLNPNTNFAQISFGDPESSTSGAIRYTHSSDSMIFNTSDNTAMTINSSGRVGIGTTSPTSTLSINSSINSTAEFVSSQNAWVRTETTDATKSATNVLKNPNQQWNISLAAQSGSNSDDDFQIQNVTTGGIPFNIDHDTNNIGMGTINPQSKLHIAENGNPPVDGQTALRLQGTYGGGLSMIDGAKQGTIHTRDNGDTIAFGIGDNIGAAVSPKMVLRSPGNLGLGTLNPGAKLEVNGQVKITGGSPGAGKVLTSDAAGLASWQSTGDFMADGSTPMTGTLSLQGDHAQLELGKTGQAGAMRFARGSDGSFAGKLGFRDASTSGLFDVFVQGGGAELQLGSQSDITFATGNTYTNAVERMRIDSGGDVGIGTTNPVAKLDVVGDIRVTHSGGNSISLNPLDGSGTSGSRLRYGGTGTLADSFELVGVGDTTRLHIAPGGNVGIGTTAPNEKLHTIGNIRASSSMISDAGKFSNNENNDYVLVDPSDDSISFFSNNNNLAKILSNGNMGIGTTSPSSKLDIVGGQTVLRNGTPPTFGDSVTDSQSLHTYVDDANVVMVSEQDENTGSTGGYVFFMDDDGTAAPMFMIRKKSAPGSNLLTLNSNGNLSVSGSITGSTINANDSDTLDGLNSTQFLRSDTSDSMNGNLNVSGRVTSGEGSGAVAMTINDGGGNANLTFNHEGKVADQNGNAGRITVNVDSTSNATMDFQLGDNLTAGASTNLSSILTLKSDGTVNASSFVGNLTGTASNATDADKLDNLDSSQFLRSDTNDSMGGDLTLNNVVLNAGQGRGLKFWGSDAYKISMGNSAEYNYGPVTDYSMKFSMNGTAGRGWTWGATGSTPVAALHNTGKMQIAGSMTASSFLYTSDKRLKKDVQPLSNALDRVLNLEGVSFKWKKDNEEDIGFIAQEVENHEPSLVATQKNKPTDDTPANVKSVKYGNIVALLVEAIKELKKDINSIFISSDDNKREITSLKQENEQLKRKLSEQEKRLERLERLIDKK